MVLLCPWYPLCFKWRTFVKRSIAACLCVIHFCSTVVAEEPSTVEIKFEISCYNLKGELLSESEKVEANALVFLRPFGEDQEDSILNNISLTEFDNLVNGKQKRRQVSFSKENWKSISNGEASSVSEGFKKFVSTENSRANFSVHLPKSDSAGNPMFFVLCLWRDNETKLTAFVPFLSIPTNTVNGQKVRVPITHTLNVVVPKADPPQLPLCPPTIRIQPRTVRAFPCFDSLKSKR